MKKHIFSHLFMFFIFSSLCSQEILSLDSSSGLAPITQACSLIQLTNGFHFKAETEKSLRLATNSTVCPPSVQNSNITKNENHIIHITPTSETKSIAYANGIINLDRTLDPNAKALVSIQYFDGFGRPSQSVQVGVTPSQKDLVTLQEYDGFGREEKAWLPTITAKNGAYIDAGTVKYEATKLYADTRPFSHTFYESSPLNRVSKQVGAGEDWYKNNNKGKTLPAIGNTKTITKVEHIKNSSVDPLLQCLDYWIEMVWVETDQYHVWRDEPHPSGTIDVEKITYSDKSTTLKFRDSRVGNNIILIRNVNVNDISDTYYVYIVGETENRIYCIVLPEAVDAFNPHESLDEQRQLLQYTYLIGHGKDYGDTMVRYPTGSKEKLSEEKYNSLVDALLKYGETNSIEKGTILDDLPVDRSVKMQYITGLDYQRERYYAIKDEEIDGVSKTILYSVSLSKTGGVSTIKTQDEDFNLIIESKDAFGRIIKINQDRLYNGGTFYLYDLIGNLRCVMPPIATDRLRSWNNHIPDIDVAKNDIIKQYAYLYNYDRRQRCIEKKLPGVEPMYYIYDKADQLIFSQDGEQRKKSEWAFSIPDAFGRVALTGVCKQALTVGNQIDAVVKATLPDAVNGVLRGYTVSGVTLSSPTITSVNYYDSYKYLGKNSFPNYVFDSTQGADFNKMYGTQNEVFKHKGLLTGAIIAQFNSNNTITYLYSTMYYDDKGQVIQNQSSNHLGGKDTEYIAYNFTGQPTRKLHVHTASGQVAQTELYAYTYDHAGRLTDTRYKLNGDAEILVASNTYDELGRLKTNKKGNNSNLTTTYDYNIRSWTSKISSLLFTQNLYYNTAPSGSSVTPQYGGNISAMSWQVEKEAERKYGFTYDGLSRLTHAAYDYKASGGNFSTSYSYDKHGNMMSHVQRGVKTKGAQNNSYDMVDNLAMSYNGNQLINVHNGGTGSNESTSAHFDDYSKDPNKTKVEYTYNANGAMTADLNKGSAIQYNSLNLPTILTIDNTKARGDIQYTYSASGQKLRTVHKEDMNLARMPVVGVGAYATPSWIITTTDYVGNKIYEQVGNNARVLKRILIDGGYYDAVKKKYFYYLTDHLGNNRVVAEANGTLAQKTHYYPFGMAFAEETVKDEGQKEQPYKYNGKELDRRLQLNTYDYSARYMDPAIGRFTSVDPLAEKYYSWSPYAYVMNNPLKYIDPDGRQVKLYPSKKDTAGALDFVASASGMKDLVTLTTALISLVDDSKVASTFNVTESGIDFVPVSGKEVGEAVTGLIQPAPKGSKAVQLQKNATQGSAFEQVVKKNITNSGHTNAVEQITVKAENGVKTRVDIASKDPSGKIALTEAKSSSSAPLTKNQGSAFPSIQESGGVVVGKGKPGFEGGTVIPPTKVDIVRPK